MATEIYGNLSKYLTEHHISKMNHDHGNLLNSIRMKLVNILGQLEVLDSFFHQNLSSQFQFSNHSKVIIYHNLLIHNNLLEFSTQRKLIGGLCGFFHRSLYQDFDSLSMIPIGGTILILQLLDVLLDVSKKDKKV